MQEASERRQISFEVYDMRLFNVAEGLFHDNKYKEKDKNIFKVLST